MAPSPRQQMYIQRLYLYLNMTKPSEQLYLSYAKVNSEGKGIRPSYLIDTVRKLFPAMSVEYPQNRSRLEQIEGRQEGARYLAEELREYVEGTLPEEERQDFYLMYRAYEADAAGPGRHFADTGRAVCPGSWPEHCTDSSWKTVSAVWKLMLPVPADTFCNMVFPCRNGKNSASRLRIWVRYIMQYWKTLQENLQNPT